MRAVVAGSDERSAVDAERMMFERRILVVSFRALVFCLVGVVGGDLSDYVESVRLGSMSMFPAACLLWKGKKGDWEHLGLFITIRSSIRSSRNDVTRRGRSIKRSAYTRTTHALAW